MKKFIALLLTLSTVITLAVFTFTVGASAAAWDGTTVDTAWYNTTDIQFTLTTGEQLAGLAAIVNGTATGITADSFTGKTIILGADVDLGSKNWLPIGTSNGAFGTTGGFAGIFDGQKHTISNLSVNNMADFALNGNRYAFFGILSGTAKDINFVGASIKTQTGYSAVIVGYISGGTVVRCTIDSSSVVDCYTSANGMIAGRVEKTGTIDSCINYGNIIGYGIEAGSTANVIIGGIVGLADSSVVKNCVNYGDVTALAQTGLPSQSGAAGIAGFVKTAEITNCVNYGKISFTDYMNSNTGTGGIVGKFHSGANSLITNCYNFGDVLGKDNDVTQTGLIGGLPQVLGTIENCYSVTSGNLAATGSTMVTGFIVSNVTIVGKTDAAYTAMQSAAAAIESAISEVTNKITVHYVYSGGEKAADDKVVELREGEDYSIGSPTIVGYNPDQTTLSGKMGNAAIELTVTYSLKDCELTIEYVYEDGTKAADSYVSTKPYGTDFSVASPEIAGFDPSFAVVEGKFEMNRTITVKYKSNGTLTTAVTEPAGNDTQAQTTAAVTEPDKSGSCGSSIGVSTVFIALTSIFSSFVIIKRNKE